MAEHFNSLTPRESELISMLAEEAAEIVQICMKIQRHGMYSYHPDDEKKIGNIFLLEEEITDFLAVRRMMLASGYLSDNRHQIQDTIDKKMRYMHHFGDPS